MFQYMNSNLYPTRIIKQLVDSAFRGCHPPWPTTLSSICLILQILLSQEPYS